MRGLALISCFYRSSNTRLYSPPPPAGDRAKAIGLNRPYKEYPIVAAQQICVSHSQGLRFSRTWSRSWEKSSAEPDLGHLWCEVTAIIPFPTRISGRARFQLVYFILFFPIATYGLSPILRHLLPCIYFVGIARLSVEKVERRAGATFTYRGVFFFPIVTELCSKCLKQCDELRDDLVSSLLWQASFPATTYQR